VVPTGVVPTVAPVEAPSGEPAAYPPPLAGGQPAPELSDSLLSAALNQREVSPDLEDVLAAVIAVLRTLAAASGLGADEVELAVARMLAFTRRRLSGDYTVDDFGFDPDFVEHVFLPIARLLYRQWFRVEVRGIEHLPTTGSALLVANHSGTIALDAHMLQVAVHDEHPAQRNLRLLGADLVFRTPVVGTIARKQGATLASNADAERLLSSGEIVAVFPEGFKGVGKPFRERYKLQRFGRGGFVNAAVRTGAPIIPVSIIGAEETYPLIGDIRLLARLLGAGASCDAHHMTAPDPSGLGVARAIHAALADAGLEVRVAAGRVGAVVGALVGVVGVAVVEQAACLIEHAVHPTPGGGAVDPQGPVDLVRDLPRPVAAEAIALSTNFAFGGSNAAVVLTGGG
jgi:1-acyl-sn-glycerol-3-phosphate acyltransferase